MLEKDYGKGSIVKLQREGSHTIVLELQRKCFGYRELDGMRKVSRRVRR